jgi:hypothetical protein
MAVTTHAITGTAEPPRADFRFFELDLGPGVTSQNGADDKMAANASRKLTTPALTLSLSVDQSCFFRVAGGAETRTKCMRGRK